MSPFTVNPSGKPSLGAALRLPPKAGCRRKRTQCETGQLRSFRLEPSLRSETSGSRTGRRQDEPVWASACSIFAHILRSEPGKLSNHNLIPQYIVVLTASVGILLRQKLLNNREGASVLKNPHKNPTITRKFFRRFEIFFETKSCLRMKISPINFWQKRFVVCDTTSYRESRCAFNFSEVMAFFLLLCNIIPLVSKVEERRKQTSGHTLLKKRNLSTASLKSGGFFFFRLFP
jgi:hypothetical protein